MLAHRETNTDQLRALVRQFRSRQIGLENFKNAAMPLTRARQVQFS